jgi:hypothetical protein
LGYGEHYRTRSPRGSYIYPWNDDACRRREAGRNAGCRPGGLDGLCHRRGKLTGFIVIVIIIIETTGSAAA